MVKILIVDDNNDFNDLMFEALSIYDKYDIDQAFDGQEAFKMAIKKDYDLILMDLHMPKMTGQECIQALYQANPKQKYFIISGNIDDDVIEDLTQYGAIEFISKPINFASVSKKIDSYFEK